jgi:hypothetical protein
MAVAKAAWCEGIAKEIGKRFDILVIDFLRMISVYIPEIEVA